MKLISNRRISSTTSPTGAGQREPFTPETSGEAVGVLSPSPGTTLPPGAAEAHTEEPRLERRGRSSGGDPMMGVGSGAGADRIGPRNSVSILPSEETAPASADAVEPPPPPPPISASEQVDEPRDIALGEESVEDRHRVTWVMLRLLAANGKVKAADGSDLLVSYLGEEPPLGDVFQIEAISPDMEQRTMTVVVLANQESVEVLGAQEIIVVDSAPFQIERQPITTSQELAEAIYKYIEIELRPMGDILVNAAREALSSGS